MSDVFEAEQGLIGSVILDQDVFEKVGHISPQAFSYREHALIWKWICKLAGKGDRLDPVILKDAMSGEIPPEDTNWAYIANQCVISTPSAAGVSRYADIVEKAFLRRELRRICTEAAYSDQDVDPITAINELATRLQTLGEAQTAIDYRTVLDGLRAHHAEMCRREEGTAFVVPSGLDALDDKLAGGFHAGELTIVAARPAMGKTGFSLNVAMNGQQVGTVFYTSLEMGEVPVFDRLLCNLGSIPMQWMRNPRLREGATAQEKQEHDRNWARYTMAHQQGQDMNILFDYTPAQDVRKLCLKIRRTARQQKLSMVVVDYLGLLRGSEHEKQELRERLGMFTKELRALAKDLQIPVLVLAQLNRNCDGRTDKRPMISDLKDSGDIEQDADCILFLYRDEVYRPNTPFPGVCEVIIGKQRQGPTTTVATQFEGLYQRFSNYEGVYDPNQQTSANDDRGFSKKWGGKK